jgi:hypothetical protein
MLLLQPFFITLKLYTCKGLRVNDTWNRPDLVDQAGREPDLVRALDAPTLASIASELTEDADLETADEILFLPQHELGAPSFEIGRFHQRQAPTLRADPFRAS